MIATQVITDPSVSLIQAEAEIASKLGGTIDPYKDYIQEKATNSDYVAAHKTAQVIAQVMAEQQANIKQTLASSGVSLGDKEEIAILAVINKVVTDVVAKVIRVIESNLNLDTTTVASNFNDANISADTVEESKAKVVSATTKQEVDASTMIQLNKTFMTVFVDNNGGNNYQAGAAALKLTEQGLYRYDCQQANLMNDLDTCFANVQSAGGLISFVETSPDYKLHFNYTNNYGVIKKFISSKIKAGETYKVTSFLSGGTRPVLSNDRFTPQTDLNFYALSGYNLPNPNGLDKVVNTNEEWNQDSLYGNSTLQNFINNMPTASNPMLQNNQLWWLEGDVQNSPSSVRMHICEQDPNNLSQCKVATEVNLDARLAYDLTPSKTATTGPWLKMLNPGLAGNYSREVYFIETTNGIYRYENLIAKTGFNTSLLSLEAAKAIANALRANGIN